MLLPFNNFFLFFVFRILLLPLDVQDLDVQMYKFDLSESYERKKVKHTFDLFHDFLSLSYLFETWSPRNNKQLSNFIDRVDKGSCPCLRLENYRLSIKFFDIFTRPKIDILLLNSQLVVCTVQFWNLDRTKYYFRQQWTYYRYEIF